MPPSGTAANCSSVAGLTMPRVCSPLLTTSKSPGVGGSDEDLTRGPQRGSPAGVVGAGIGNMDPNESNRKTICIRNIFASRSECVEKAAADYRCIEYKL